MSAIDINHINIRAPLEMINTVRDFYCSALNLHVGARPSFNSQGYWLYAGSKALIHLSICKEQEICSPHLKNTLNHIAFTCTNQQQMRANLTAMGVEFTLDQVANTNIEQIFFYDPAGNGVELTFSGSE